MEESLALVPHDTGKLELVRTKTDKPARNYKAEALSRQGNLALKMAEVKQARLEATTSELMQVAQVMCFCGLPYKRTSEQSVIRQARTASGDTITVTFRAMIAGVDIPFGTDRSLLHWIFHRAVMNGDPFIEMSSTGQYLRDMGITDTGGNIKRVREAFQRIASFALVVQREGTDYEQLIMPIIKAARLPRGLRFTPANSQKPLQPLSGKKMGFTIADDVFREVMAHHVPALTKMLQVTRESPQMQDAMLFLQWRSFAARSETFIPWAALREQMWTEDTNPWRMKARFADAIKALGLAWPQLNAEALTKSLRIGPPRGGTQFLLK